MFALHGYKKKCLLYVPLISYFVCCQTKLYFKPKRVVIDSEVAIHKAVGNIWPNVTVMGCKSSCTMLV
jgi:hypothetical protein